MRVPYPLLVSGAPPSLHELVTDGAVAFNTGAASSLQDLRAGKKRSIFTLPTMLLPDTIVPKPAVALSLESKVRLSFVVMAELVTAPYKSALAINNVSAGTGATLIPVVFALISDEIVLFKNQFPDKFCTKPDVPLISTIPRFAFILPTILFNVPVPLCVILVEPISKVPCFKLSTPFTVWLVAMVTIVGLSVVRSFTVVGNPPPVTWFKTPL